MDRGRWMLMLGLVAAGAGLAGLAPAQAWQMTTADYDAKDSDIPALGALEPFFPAWSGVNISSPPAIGWGPGSINYAGPFALGFPFDYYGVPRTQFWVGQEGYLGFASTADVTAGAYPMNSADTPNDVIAAYWIRNHRDDCAFSKVTQEVVPLPATQLAPRAHVVQWLGLEAWGICSSAMRTNNFQVRLYEGTDVIEVLHEDVGNQITSTATRAATVGIRGNGAGTAMEYTHTTAAHVIQDHLMQFRPPGVFPLAVADTYTLDAQAGTVSTFLVDVAQGMTGLSDNDRRIGHAPVRPRYEAGSLSGPFPGAWLGTLGGTASALDEDGSFQFRLPPASAAPNPCGTYTFRYWAEDAWGHDPAAPVTVRLDVVNCNDPPTVAALDLVADEDVPLPVPLVASDPNGNPLTYTVVGPTFGTVTGVPAGPVAAPPTLTYRHDAQLYNRLGARADSFQVTVDDGRGGSATATVTVDTRPVNDPPLLAVAPVATAEDDPAAAPAPSYVTALLPAADAAARAFDEDNQQLTLAVASPCDAAFFAVCPQVDPVTRELGFVPHPAVNGVRTVVLRARDDGTHQYTGPLAPPAPDPRAADVPIQLAVQAVNDAPQLATTASVLATPEDAAVDLPAAAWLAYARPGRLEATDEAAQALAWSVSPCDAAFFAACPAVDPVTRRLSYAPRPDVFGDRTVAVRLEDDGTRDAAGLVPRAASVPLTLRVLPVNDAPVPGLGARVVVDEDSASAGQPARTHVLPAWATPAVGPDPGQSVAAYVLAGFDAALFAQPPRIAPDGTLTFTLAPDAFGTTAVAATLFDDGPHDAATGDANRTAAVFEVEVRPVPDAPVAVDDAPAPLLAGVPGQSIPLALLLGNDADADGDALDVPFVHVTDVVGGTLAAAPGALRFTPADGFTGAAGFRYRASDGTLLSAPAQVTFQVVGSPVPVVFIEEPATRLCRDAVHLRAIAAWGGHAPVAWTWDAGDGTPPQTVALAAPASTFDHTYASPGDRTPTVAVVFVDGAGARSAPVPATRATPVRVEGCHPPAAAFDVAASGTDVRFLDRSRDLEAGALQHAWDFGDGATSSEASPRHAYAAPGVYTVRLTVTDAEGDTDVLARTIVVPAAGAGAGVVGAPVLGGGSAAGSAGAAAEAGAAVAPTAPLNRPPVAAVAQAGPVAPDATVWLDAGASFDPDGDALAFRWRQVRGPPVVLVGADTPRASLRAPDASAHLAFLLRISDGSASDTAVVEVAVAGPATAGLGFLVLPEDGAPGTFVFHALGAAGAALEWRFGDGASSTDASPRRAFPPGTHEVRLRAHGPDGVRESVQVVAVAGPQDLDPDGQPLHGLPERPRGGVPVAALAAAGGLGALALVLLGAFGAAALLRRRA